MLDALLTMMLGTIALLYCRSSCLGIWKNLAYCLLWVQIPYWDPLILKASFNHLSMIYTLVIGHLLLTGASLVNICNCSGGELINLFNINVVYETFNFGSIWWCQNTYDSCRISHIKVRKIYSLSGDMMFVLQKKEKNMFIVFRHLMVAGLKNKNSQYKFTIWFILLKYIISHSYS